MRRTRIRRRSRLLRQVGRCGETVAALDAPVDPTLDAAFVRARLVASLLAAELGHDLAAVRAELEHPTPTEPEQPR